DKAKLLAAGVVVVAGVQLTQCVELRIDDRLLVENLLDCPGVVWRTGAMIMDHAGQGAATKGHLYTYAARRCFDPGWQSVIEAARQWHGQGNLYDRFRGHGGFRNKHD